MYDDRPQMQSPDGVPNRGRGGALQCALCRCQVLPQLMSKHLVSFYHSNRVRSAPEIAGRLAMDHMGDIVRQAPFQCGPCSFYCNTMQTFLWHWGSKDHQLKDTQARFTESFIIYNIFCFTIYELSYNITHVNALPTIGRIFLMCQYIF